MLGRPRTRAQVSRPSHPAGVGLRLDRGATGHGTWYPHARACACSNRRRDDVHNEQAVEEDARPGHAFGTAFLPAAENVLGVRGVTACSNHPELLGRLSVLDTWIGTQDRQRPDGAWNLLTELDDGPQPQLVAIDFGMAFSDSLFPLLGERDHAATMLVWPNEAKPLADLQAVSETLDQVEDMTEADIIKHVESTPHAWLSAEERGRVVGSLFARRRGLAGAMKELEGTRD